MPDTVGDLTKVVRKLSRENERLKAALRKLAEAAEIAAQGGLHNDGSEYGKPGVTPL